MSQASAPHCLRANFNQAVCYCGSSSRGTAVTSAAPAVAALSQNRRLPVVLLTGEITPFHSTALRTCLPLEPCPLSQAGEAHNVSSGEAQLHHLLRCSGCSSGWSWVSRSLACGAASGLYEAAPRCHLQCRLPSRDEIFLPHSCRYFSIISCHHLLDCTRQPSPPLLLLSCRRWPPRRPCPCASGEPAMPSKLPATPTASIMDTSTHASLWHADAVLWRRTACSESALRNADVHATLV